MTGRFPASLSWLAGLLAVYLLAPLLAGVQQAGMADWHTVDIGALVRACTISIISASVATAIIGLCGVPLGYVLARIPGRASAVLGFVVQLPLALPPLASGVLLLFLVGYSAPLGRLASGALTDSFIGIVLAQVFVAAPFLIIAARSAFGAIDPVLEGVAATLGRGPLATFFHVSLPIARPAILSGLLLAWLRAFGEFGATVMVAYHPYSLPIYTYVAFGSQGLPAMLPVLLPTLVLALAVMGLSGIAGGRRQARPPGAEVIASSVADPLQPDAPRNARRAKPIDVVLKLNKQLGGFRLGLAWAPHSRRLAILGPSGSGKSLTLKLIAGTERCDRATIRVGGRELSHLDPASRAIAYVPQNYGLFPHLAVNEQLRFPLGADPKLARHWIDRLGLGGLEQRLPAALSLGQQQRVALARALVRPADLLLLDEPFSALDVPLRLHLRRQLLALQNDIDATTILVTHDPAEAALLADEILVLDGGAVLQSGPTEQVFRRPAHETVARLLGAENVATGVASSATEIAIGDGVMLKVAGPALRPNEAVGWSFAPGRARIGPNGRYQGAVEDIIDTGMDRHITVRLGDARIRLVAGPGTSPHQGTCRFDIDPDTIQVWPLRAA